MEILFEKAHPPRLLAALRCIHHLPGGGKHHIRYYDSLEIDDSTLDRPVIIWKAHYKGKVDAAVQEFLDKGYRVVALRQAAGLGAFRTTAAVLGLWPKLLRVLEARDGKWLYEYGCKSFKFSEVKI